MIGQPRSSTSSHDGEIAASYRARNNVFQDAEKSDPQLNLAVRLRRCGRGRSRGCLGHLLQFIIVVPLHQIPVVIHEYVCRRDNLPVHLLQEVEFEQGEFAHGDAAYFRIRAVCPKTVAQALGGNGSNGDEIAMYGKRADVEDRVESRELVDVVDKGEQDGWGERGVHDEAVEVVVDGDAGRGSVLRLAYIYINKIFTYREWYRVNCEFLTGSGSLMRISSSSISAITIPKSLMSHFM